MESIYVEKEKGRYVIAGSRVSLDSIIHAFLQGLSPETIASECFPVLSLEQVYGGITYYLANRNALDSYLKQGDQSLETLKTSLKSADPEFYLKLSKARREDIAN